MFEDALGKISNGKPWSRQRYVRPQIRSEANLCGSYTGWLKRRAGDRTGRPGLRQDLTSGEIWRRWTAREPDTAADEAGQKARLGAEAGPVPGSHLLQVVHQRANFVHVSTLSGRVLVTPERFQTRLKFSGRERNQERRIRCMSHAMMSERVPADGTPRVGEPGAAADEVAWSSLDAWTTSLEIPLCHDTGN